MSNNQNVVYLFFYSKYSQLCLSMIDTIKKANLNVNMEYICVDNKQIRNRILNSKNIKFNSVPCILLVYPNKKIEQYEGNDAVNLVNGLISYLNQQLQQQELQKQQQQLQQQQQIIQQEEKVQQKTRDTVRDVVVENKKHKKKKVIKEQPKKKQTILDSSSDEESQGEDLHESDDEEELKVTPIDLETVEEESNDGEEEINSVTSIKRPKKHVRMNDGNYEDMYNDDDYVPPEYDTKKLRGIKTSGKKDSSISSLAQQLAKERELDQENIKPVQS